jgi:hypothetical protein
MQHCGLEERTALPARHQLQRGAAVAAARHGHHLRALHQGGRGSQGWPPYAHRAPPAQCGLGAAHEGGVRGLAAARARGLGALGPRGALSGAAVTGSGQPGAAASPSTGAACRAREESCR